nr:MAG TPA: tail assembly chaperone protein [Caudoviricetes sp.]
MSNINQMSLRGFFKDGAKKPKEFEVVISERFEENGEPIKWVIKPLTGREIDYIQNQANKVSIVNGVPTTETNQEKLKELLLEKTVKYPDLMNAELQDNYGVQSAKDLAGEMLTAGEYNYLFEVIQKYGGLTTKVNTVEELKN